MSEDGCTTSCPCMGNRIFTKSTSMDWRTSGDSLATCAWQTVCPRSPRNSRIYSKKRYVIAQRLCTTTETAIVLQLLISRDLYTGTEQSPSPAMSAHASSANGDTGVTLTGAAKLRQLLSNNSIVVAPGVYDGFTARLALRAGFDCLYMVCLLYDFCHTCKR